MGLVVVMGEVLVEEGVDCGGKVGVGLEELKQGLLGSALKDVEAWLESAFEIVVDALGDDVFLGGVRGTAMSEKGRRLEPEVGVRLWSTYSFEFRVVEFHG